MNIHRQVRGCVTCIGALALASAAHASVITGPTIGLTVDGKTQDLNIDIQPTGTGWKIPSQTFGGESMGWQVTLSGTLDTDPSIAYGLAVTDFGAPSTFSIVFSEPIVPTGPATRVNASLVGGLTDFTGNGVAITPTGTKVQTSFLDVSPMGVDVGPAQSSGPGAPGALHSYGPFLAPGPLATDTTAGPLGGPFTTLSVKASFGLSGDNDIAVLTGFVQAVTTPTVPDSGPGLLGLASLGLVLVGGALSRRNLMAA